MNFYTCILFQMMCIYYNLEAHLLCSHSQENCRKTFEEECIWLFLCFLEMGLKKCLKSSNNWIPSESDGMQTRLSRHTHPLCIWYPFSVKLIEFRVFFRHYWAFWLNFIFIVRERDFWMLLHIIMKTKRAWYHYERWWFTSNKEITNYAPTIVNLHRTIMHKNFCYFLHLTIWLIKMHCWISWRMKVTLNWIQGHFVGIVFHIATSIKINEKLGWK